ncbi:MAG: glutathione S-transferase family protein [Leptolyngbyaceae cyanobacterium]
MLKLYGGAFSRASIVRWYLEELDAPYEFVTLDMQAGEHRQDDFLTINPMGKVPALVDGEITLWESGAILLYLAEKFGNMPGTHQERGLLYQWVLFANSTLSEGLFNESLREKQTPRLLQPLDDLLKTQPYLMADTFTVADVAVVSLLGFAVQMIQLDMSAYPAVQAYLQRCSQRSAFQKAMSS